MRSVDLDRFWADDAVARKDPFGKNIPQFPMGIGMNSLCIWDELGIPIDMQRYGQDEAWALSLNKAYNDKAEKIVGKRLLNEKPSDPTRRWPGTKQIGEVMGGKNIWHDQSWWLQAMASTPDELRACLDRLDERDIRKAMLPEDWDERKGEIQKRHQQEKPRPFRGFRGPVTLAMSLYGVENTIYLIMDEPKLAERFRNAILRTALAMADIMDAERGEAPATVKNGFSFADDNCCMLTPEMYEFFGFPILKALFERYSPDPPRTSRYQHSDSAMAHLLPVLGRLKFTGANFGPTVRFREIREHMPQCVVQGTLAPYTFMRNDEEGIIAELRRDFDEARETRGLLVATAGSVNDGSLLTSLRTAMWAIQTYGRLD